MSAASPDVNNVNGCVVGLNIAPAADGGGGSGDVDVVGGGEGSLIAALDVEVKIEVKGVAAEEKSGVKKRGRPARFQARAQPKAAQPRAQSKAQAKVVDDEEDVCFICFDGGNLVLCDRRGCPKAYHPACIKRDEAFFQSKSKWNCGWHLCSNCEKASHYMCYTCTYSLCKSCIKDADILCVRGNKGFCPLCMKTIMLIENSEQGNKDSVQVDFDDKSSWEYLFKVYWVYLKTKLSLTFDELTKSKNPGKGATSTMKIKSQEKLFGGNDDKDYSSDSFSDYQEGEDHRRKKAKKMAKLPNKEEPGNMPKIYNEKLLSVPNGEHWASEELLEFVAHVKNGDISVLSQFDVQALLLEYVKTNNLRDPRRKSQIICDSRLLKMFGKARVGHFEMLKLLELHFLNQEESQVNNIIEGVFIGAGATQVEVGALANKTILGRDKKRKTRKIGVDKGPQTNLDEYAAIDVHNISLIYLRRSLMESLVDDIENFQRKIVGAVVRIRISSSDQSHDYRLVRVVGTSKVANPYKVGERTLDVMLEILNLDKKEVICIDEISNQEFSKDECVRLRRSMKCGIVERFTVGDILNKALALQAVRVNDVLEAEISRLNHLRDRANEKGLRKDLRECVEKLQLLNTAEERQRRELEIPQVNADPHMDPNYESDDHGDSGPKKPDENLEPISSNISKRGMKPIMKYGTCETVKSINGREKTVSSSEQNRSMSTAVYPDKESATRTTGRENGPPVNPQNDAHRPNTTEGWDNQAVVRSEPSTTDSTDHNEVEKVWNYRDPSGRIQGPFSMLQLRKWSTSGYFPPDLQIWRSSDEESDTVFLTDAMNGHNHKELQVMHTSFELTTNSTINAKVNPPDVNSELMTERSSQGCVTIQGKDFEPDYSDKSNLIISPTFSGKVSASVSREEGGEEEDRRFSESQSGPSHKPESKPQPSPVDSSTNTWDIAFTLVSITKSLAEQNHEVDFPKLPSPTPKPNSETEDKQSVPPNDHIQDSDPNWSNNAPILVGGEAQIPVATNEWGGYSPTPTKPSNDVWDLDLNLVSGSLSEPSEMNGNLASDLNAKIEELFCSSPSNPVSTTTDWQALVTGTSEFPLTDEWFPEESVSDLLAEVDAMESLNKGPLSPTSAMNCTIEGLSPTSYTGKSDAMSCSSNILMPCQSANGPNAPFQKRSGGESLTNDEAEGETQPPDSSSASWEMPGGADGDWRGGPEIIETGREQVHRNPSSLNWGGPVQININMGWGNGQGNPPQANANINWVNPHGNLGPWPNQQPQYIGAERFLGQRVDRSSFLGGGGSSYGRESRPSRNNRAAPSFGGGGSSFRPSPKGRICKFFESGHCRKGLKCDYLHP